MITYKRHSGSKHEHRPDGSCRSVLHSHPGGGTKHSHEPVTERVVFDQPPPPDGLQPELADECAALTPRERHVIAMLQYLGTLWPRSLTLISMDGNLHVMRTADPRFEGERRTEPERQEVIIADIDGIPNDGGAW